MSKSFIFSVQILHIFCPNPFEVPQTFPNPDIIISRDKGDDINPVPAVEQGETYENAAANDLDIAQNSYPHVPQLV